MVDSRQKSLLKKVQHSPTRLKFNHYFQPDVLPAMVMVQPVV